MYNDNQQRESDQVDDGYLFINVVVNFLRKIIDGEEEKKESVVARLLGN